MKITKQRLQKVIQEELAAELTEEEMRGSLKQMSKWKDMVLHDAGDDQILDNIGKRLTALTPNLQAEFIVDIVKSFGLSPDQAVLRNALIKGAQAAKSAAAKAPPKRAHPTGIARQNPADAFMASHGRGPGGS
jgi:hypothetical protein